MESPGIISVAAKTLSNRSENSLRPEASFGIVLGHFSSWLMKVVLTRLQFPYLSCNTDLDFWYASSVPIRRQCSTIATCFRFPATCGFKRFNLMSGSSGLESTRALKALFHTGYCRGSPLNTEIESLGKCPDTNSCLLTVIYFIKRVDKGRITTVKDLES